MTSDFQEYGPRGKPIFPEWKQAKQGDRVRHVRTGREGTVKSVTVGQGSTKHMTVDWDDTGFGVSRGRVVAPAYDLEPVR